MSGSGRIPRQLAVAGLGLGLLLLALGLGPERARQSEGQATLRNAIEVAAAQGSSAAEAGPAEAPSEGEGGTRAEPAPRPAARAGLWLRLAGFAHRQAGWIGVFALQWSFCFFGALGLIWGLRARLGGGGAIVFVAVALFGSVLALATTYLVPELFSFFCVALAGALVWGRRALPASEPADVFQGELSDERGIWRWAVAGAAFGLALVAGPWLLPVAVPLVAAARPGRRGPAGGLFAVGAATGFGAAIAGGGWPWAPLELWFDPALWGWNALFVLAGRSLGLLPFFLPAWIALARPATDEGRRWIPWSVLGALVLLLATAPFDLGGDAGAPLLASFLPLYALLLLLPAGDFDRRALLFVLVALPVLAPAWLDAAGANDRPWARKLDLVRHILPLETTQRQVAGLSTLDRSSGVVLHGVAPAVRGGGRGRLELVEARATLIVESAVPLSAVRLELGAGAPASFEVEGGELGDVLYRPNGDVAVDVRLGSATRRHPTWRSPAGAAVAVFDLVLPEPPAAPIPFDLSQARPEGLGGEEP